MPLLLWMVVQGVGRKRDGTQLCFTLVEYVSTNAKGVATGVLPIRAIVRRGDVKLAQIVVNVLSHQQLQLGSAPRRCGWSCDGNCDCSAVGIAAAASVAVVAGGSI